MLYFDKEISLQTVRAKASFHMISDNVNGFFVVVNCSVYTNSTAPKSEYHNRSKDVVAYALKK